MHGWGSQQADRVRAWHCGLDGEGASGTRGREARGADPRRASGSLQRRSHARTPVARAPSPAHRGLPFGCPDAPGEVKARRCPDSTAKLLPVEPRAASSGIAASVEHVDPKVVPLAVHEQGSRSDGRRLPIGGVSSRPCTRRRFDGCVVLSMAACRQAQNRCAEPSGLPRKERHRTTRPPIGIANDSRIIARLPPPRRSVPGVQGFARRVRAAANRNLDLRTLSLLRWSRKRGRRL